ncbi:hypothetical protein LXL04_002943 [Taraxacum kok-saghyz]
MCRWVQVVHRQWSGGGPVVGAGGGPVGAGGGPVGSNEKEENNEKMRTNLNHLIYKIYVYHWDQRVQVHLYEWIKVVTCWGYQPWLPSGGWVFDPNWKRCIRVLPQLSGGFLRSVEIKEPFIKESPCLYPLSAIIATFQAIQSLIVETDGDADNNSSKQSRDGSINQAINMRLRLRGCLH